MKLASLALVTAVAMFPAHSVEATTKKVIIKNFSSVKGGIVPAGELLRGSDGTLYGTTTSGGSNTAGTIFRMKPPSPGNTKWQFETIYEFTAKSDGSAPVGGLISDSKGALYGTALGGTQGSGVVFKLSPPAANKTAWSYNILYAFKGGSDGNSPLGGVVRGANGVLYGTTSLGGLSGCLGLTCGVVYSLTPPSGGATTWTEKILYRFKGGADGYRPTTSLVVGQGGVLYGTTEFGGDGTYCAYVCGTVFALNPATGAGAWSKTTLHKFKGGPDGDAPRARLIADADGNLYGTADLAVFELVRPASGSGTWTKKNLYAYGGAAGSPMSIRTPLVPTADGGFMGTSTSGGSSYLGTVFKISPKLNGWTTKVIHSFSGGNDGALPLSGLVLDGAGIAYGTTSAGGTSSAGTVYMVTP